MKPFPLLFMLLVFVASLHADNFTTLEGDSYTNATIKRVEPDGLMITYPDGVVKLKFKKLPREIGAKYGYSPDSAAHFEEMQSSNQIASYQKVIETVNEQLNKDNTHFVKVAEKANSQYEKRSSLEKLKTAQWNVDLIQKQINQGYARLSELSHLGNWNRNESEENNIKAEIAKREVDLKRYQNELTQIQSENKPPSPIPYATAIPEPDSEAVNQISYHPPEQGNFLDSLFNFIFHKGKLEGEVFIVTKGAENYKLGAINVSLYSVDSLKPLEETIKQANANILRLNPLIDAAVREKSVWEVAWKQQLESDAGKNKENPGKGPTLDRYEASQKAYYKLYNERQEYLKWEHYFSALPTPIATAESNAEGKFEIDIPKRGEFVLAAKGTRMVGNEHENYYWLVKVSLIGSNSKKINLSNNNLTTAYSLDSLIFMGY